MSNSPILLMAGKYDASKGLANIIGLVTGASEGSDICYVLKSAQSKIIENARDVGADIVENLSIVNTRGPSHYSVIMYGNALKTVGEAR